MDHFDDIIAPLLLKKYRIRNINRFAPKRNGNYGGGNYRPVITPLGRFNSVTAAALAEGVTKNAISLKLIRKTPGYEYDT